MLTSTSHEISIENKRELYLYRRERGKKVTKALPINKKICVIKSMEDKKITKKKISIKWSSFILIDILIFLWWVSLN